MENDQLIMADSYTQLCEGQWTTTCNASCKQNSTDEC